MFTGHSRSSEGTRGGAFYVTTRALPNKAISTGDFAGNRRPSRAGLGIPAPACPVHRRKKPV